MFWCVCKQVFKQRLKQSSNFLTKLYIMDNLHCKFSKTLLINRGLKHVFLSNQIISYSTTCFPVLPRVFLLYHVFSSSITSFPVQFIIFFPVLPNVFLVLSNFFLFHHVFSCSTTCFPVPPRIFLFYHVFSVLPRVFDPVLVFSGPTTRFLL